MFGLYEKLEELDRQGKPIRVALIGAGAMGAPCVGQIELAPGMEMDVVIDINLDNARKAFRWAGVPEADVVVCETAEEVDQALAGGKKAISKELSLAWTRPSTDVVVEVTGVPRLYAEVGLKTIQAKKHYITFNVEGDVCVGHLMRMLADNAGVVYSGIYGDEPGCAMLLYSEARSLGMEVVALGRSDMGGGDIKWNKESIKAPLRRDGTPDEVLETMNTAIFASFCDGSKTNEECTMMANATGLRPDTRGMNRPVVAHEEFALKVPDLMKLKKDGGVLDHTGVVECILPDEPEDTIFPKRWDRGIWEFCVVKTPQYLMNMSELGGNYSGDTPNLLLYMPYHYVYIQAPITVATAVIDGRAVVAPLKAGRVADSITMAKKDLAVGEVIDEIGGFCATGRIELASVTRKERLLPFALAHGAKMVKAVPAGGFVTWDDVVFEGEPTLIMALRKMQDQLFVDLQ